MQIESIASQLLNQSRVRSAEVGASENKKSNAGQIVALVNQRASSTVEQSYFGRNPSFSPSFEFVARSSTEDVFAQKDVIENRDVFETRPVYEDQEILETKIQGSRDLSGFASLSEAGIRRGARFSMTVGDGPLAKVKFVDARKISVKVDGSVQKFTFRSNDGSFRAGLLDALNSIDGLAASYTKDGRLSLETSDGASLTLANMGKSPLARLGLREGTIDPEVIGYQQVQVGTERVKVGERTVVVGTETVKVGTKQVADGYDRELTGFARSDLFNVESLTAKLADDSFTSPSKYAELLFGVVPAEANANSPFVSSAEAKSAYDATLGEDRLLTDEKSDDVWPPANKLHGWL